MAIAELDRHLHETHATGREHASHLAQRRGVVGNVLEHVVADQHVDGPVGQRDVGDRAEQVDAAAVVPDVHADVAQRRQLVQHLRGAGRRRDLEERADRLDRRHQAGGEHRQEALALEALAVGAPGVGTRAWAVAEGVRGPLTADRTEPSGDGGEVVHVLIIPRRPGQPRLWRAEWCGDSR